MPFEGPIEDRLAIRELVESYGDAVFQRDADAWAACWAEESIWNLAGMEVSGKANIVGMWRQAMAGFSYVSFFATPGRIQIEGAHATMRSYTLEFLVEAGGKARRVDGQYDDTLIKVDGRWVFERRTYRILNDA